MGELHMKQDRYLIHVSEWLKHLTAEGYSEYTIKKSYKNAVLHAYRSLKEAGYPTGVRLIREEEARHVIKNAYRGNPVYVAAWNNFLKFNKNPTIELLNWKPQRQKRWKVDWLNLETGEDMDAWEAASTTMERALVHKELHLGLRRVSVMKFQRPWYKGTHLDVLGKGRHGGSWRTIPSHGYTQDIMKELDDHRDEIQTRLERKSCAPVTPANTMIYLKGDSAGHYGDESLNRFLKTVSTRARIKFSHHTLRRTFGRSMWKAGVESETIAAVMGHEDSKQTISYLGICFSDTESAMMRLEAWQQRRKTLMNAPETLKASTP
jgi:hypothetical protein